MDGATAPPAAATAPVKPDAELSLSAGAKRAAGVRDQTSAPAANAETRDAIRASHQKTLTERTTAAATAPPEATRPAPDREDLDSIEIEFRGRTFEISRLQGSSTYRIAGIMQDDPASSAFAMIARSLIAVTKIDGKPVPPMLNKIDVLRFMDEIGVDAVDIITAAQQAAWPPVTLADLKVIKKNLRQP